MVGLPGNYLKAEPKKEKKVFSCVVVEILITSYTRQTEKSHNMSSVLSLRRTDKNTMTLNKKAATYKSDNSLRVLTLTAMLEA